MTIRELKDFLLYYCPDIPGLRKFLAQKKVRQLRSHLIPEQEVLLGEADFEERRRIVEKYIAKWPKYCAIAEKMIQKLLRDAPSYRNRTDHDAIRVEMHFCRLAYGFAADEYLFFGLEDKSPAERRTYVSHLERISNAFCMNDFSQMQVFNDKWKTYCLLKPFYRRDAVMLSKPWHFSRFREFVKAHPVFVKKQVNLSWGQSVALVDSNGCGRSGRELFDQLIASGKVILEEPIVQSPAMAAFNPDSVNTIRCVTLNTRRGIEIFPHSFMKNGRKGSFVDNGGAGGVLVGIDDCTGIVDTDGMDELGCIYSAHPDTGVVYKGYQLPDWDQMIATCKEMARYAPKMKYCSWDMAHTKDGWVVVEGNMAGQMVGQQMTINRGVKADLEAAMSEMDLMV